MSRWMLAIVVVASGGLLLLGFGRGTTGQQIDEPVASLASIDQGSPEVRTVEASQKNVLVELFTSQGCNYCPTAEKLVERLEAQRKSRDRLIALAFHVDYFNEPWTDPFSSRSYSGRQWAYSQAAKERDPDSKSLYFTPLVLFDGQYPMSGYNSSGVRAVWPYAKQRLDRTLQARAEAFLSVSIVSPSDEPSKRTVTVRARARVARLNGQEVLAGLAVAEGPLTTKVPSGENAGATLVEHNVVRLFEAKPIELSRDTNGEAVFELELGEGWDPSKCQVVALLQDESTGYVLQAASISWSPESTQIGAR